MSGLLAKNCEECGLLFTTNTKSSKYCSDRCREASRKKRIAAWRANKTAEVRKRLGTRMCAVCGKEFAPRNNNMVTCSVECSETRKKAMRQVVKKKPKAVKPEPIGKINGKARAMGMSYGKYQMMMYMEAQRKER